MLSKISITFRTDVFGESLSSEDIILDSELLCVKVFLLFSS